MKNFLKIASIIGLTTMAQTAYPSEITDSYNTGDTLTATTLETIKGAVNDNNTRISTLEAKYMIGDTGPAGGWVFYVDAEGRHGLEASLAADEHAGIRWYNGVFTDTEANGDGLGAGEMNTMLIIANQGSDSTTYAAGFAANLVITSGGVDYGDWYLPSKYELNLMYLNIGQGSTTIGNVGGFDSLYYWSSSEFGGNGAWVQIFDDGSQFGVNKGIAGRVRAVRAF